MHKTASEHPFRKLRRQRNLTQEEAARLIDDSQETVSHWETRRSTPSVAACKKLRAVFPELSIEDLLGLTPDTAAAP
jgi:DNA-binding transcriptional regulator YiaG